jgi:hypothetical protein
MVERAKFDWDSLIAIIVITLAGIGLVSIVRDPPHARIIVVPVVYQQAAPIEDPASPGDTPVQRSL